MNITIEAPVCLHRHFNLLQPVGASVPGQPPLRVAISGGVAADANRRPVDVERQDLTLADDATNYVELTPEGVVVANTDAFTGAPSLALWTVTTHQGCVTAYRDCRGLVVYP